MRSKHPIYGYHQVNILLLASYLHEDQVFGLRCDYNRKIYLLSTAKAQATHLQ